MAMTDIKTQVRALHAFIGDTVSGSGETIVCVSVGVRTPRGKVDVVLEKNGRRRTATWGASTIIGVISKVTP
jgi:hypothetical protein